jgi:hypothetical protein
LQLSLFFSRLFDCNPGRLPKALHLQDSFADDFIMWMCRSARMVFSEVTPFQQKAKHLLLFETKHKAYFA